MAVQRVHDGWPQATVAAVLGVHPRTLQRWLASYRARGAAGLQPRPHPGAAPKLPRRKQGLVLGWLRKNPKSFGFPTELWTAKRVAQLIERTFGIRYHPRYLNAWLTAWGFSPQQPRRQPRERDEAGIAQIGRAHV